MCGSCSLGNCKRACITLLSVSLAALCLLLMTVLFVMAGREAANSRTRYIYTTANESNLLIGKSQVYDMSQVCMIESEQANRENGVSDEPEWVMFTDTCNKLRPTARNFNITGRTISQQVSGYYFFFVVGSSVTVKGAVSANYIYLGESDAKEDTDIEKRCTNEGNSIPNSELETGYYYICISGGDTQAHFVINVLQFYYDRDIANECRDVQYHKLSKSVCCHFGLSTQYHCVYLTTRNKTPQPLSYPNSVQIHMNYNKSLKSVLATACVFIFVLFSISCVFGVNHCCSKKRQTAN